MGEKERESVSSDGRTKDDTLREGDIMENGKEYNGQTGFDENGVAKSNEPGADDFKGGWIR